MLLGSSVPWRESRVITKIRSVVLQPVPGNSQMTSKTHRKWRNSRRTGSGDRFWWACVGSWGELTRAKKRRGRLLAPWISARSARRKKMKRKATAQDIDLSVNRWQLCDKQVCQKKKEVVVQKRELYKSLVNPLHPDLKVLNVRCGYFLSILNPSTDMWDAINGACAQNS